MSNKLPEGFDVQKRAPIAIWFTPEAPGQQACYTMAHVGGPKRYLKVWLRRSGYGGEVTDWSWVINQNAVLIWTMPGFEDVVNEMDSNRVIAETKQ